MRAMRPTAKHLAWALCIVVAVAHIPTSTAVVLQPVTASRAAPAPAANVTNTSVPVVAPSPAIAAGWVTVQACDAPSMPAAKAGDLPPTQRWLVNSDGLFKPDSAPSTCLTVTTDEAVIPAAAATVLSPCRGQAASRQSFAKLMDDHIVTTGAHPTPHAHRSVYVLCCF